jgi:hypothetical protein
MRFMTICAGRRALLVAAAILLGTNCGEQRATTAAEHPNPAGALASLSSPSLLQCPTDQTQATSAVVGILGGTVNLGVAAIHIPAGALSVPTLITVTVPASQYMEVDIRANLFTSFLFNSPVSVTIDYSRCDPASTDGTALSVWHIDPASKALLENMGGTNDTIHRSITFSTPHLSGYAIAF